MDDIFKVGRGTKERSRTTVINNWKKSLTKEPSFLNNPVEYDKVFKICQLLTNLEFLLGHKNTDLTQYDHQITLHIWRREVGLQSVHNFYRTCKTSCMLRLYICSYHWAWLEPWIRVHYKNTVQYNCGDRSRPHSCIVWQNLCTACNPNSFSYTRVLEHNGGVLSKKDNSTLI